MVGGASNRTYARVRAGDKSWVVMQLADEPIRSEEATSGPVPTEVPFVEIQSFLRARGVSVPEIHHFDRDLGQLWLDDLGDVRLLDLLLEVEGSRVDAYKPSLDVLVGWQRGTAEPGDDAPICYQRAFEPRLLRWELDHYLEWRVEAQLGRDPSPATRAALAKEFDALVDRVAAQPQILCHRDFQSTNIMVAPCAGHVLIDFQDALMGSYTYDLVSLLRDSYLALSREELDALVDHYLWLRDDLDSEAFRAAFHIQTVQRKLKDSGRFVYIDRVKGNPSYLQFIDDSLEYVRQALSRVPALSSLHALLAEIDPALA